MNCHGVSFITKHIIQQAKYTKHLKPSKFYKIQINTKLSVRENHFYMNYQKTLYSICPVIIIKTM